MEAIRYIIDALISLIVFAFLAPVILQWVRAGFRNPISQAIMRITNPLVMPLRRILPPVRKVDLASIVALLLVELAGGVIDLSLIGFGLPSPLLLAHYVIFDLARKILEFYEGAI